MKLLREMVGILKLENTNLRRETWRAMDKVSLMKKELKVFSSSMGQRNFFKIIHKSLVSEIQEIEDIGDVQSGASSVMLKKELKGCSAWWWPLMNLKSIVL